MGTSASAAITQRVISVIEPPAAPEGGLWNIVVYVPPMPDVAFMYKKWHNGQLPTDVSWIFVGYKDIAGANNYLPHADQVGRVPYPGTRGTLVDNVEQFRQTHKGLTLQLNANALCDQGMMLAGQYGDKLSVESDYPLATGSGVPVANNTRKMGSVIKMLDVPYTTAELYAKDPGAMRGAAREGAYLPLKFNSPVQMYESVHTTEFYSTNGSTIDDSPTPVALPIVLTRLRESDGVYLEEFLTVSSGTNDDLVASTVGFTNLQTGVIIGSGLDLKASIDIKTISGLEIVATGSSPFSGFMEPPLEESDAGQKQVHLIQRRMPSAHPASANMFGTLITSVLPALGGLAVELVRGWWNRFNNRAAQLSAIG